ncbi:MAG: heme exporter protein CcmB, partial [Candidatus Dormibacteraeota bacterium]|nr:heme exporter protein CcmB [Candidatus Dormibacteraeota bacterium]
LLRQDLRREWRGRAVLGVMVPFALTTGLALTFTVNLDGRDGHLAAVGAFWTASLFAMILGLGRAFAQEQENGVWEGLLLAPIEPGVLFVAQLIGNLAILGVLDVVNVPVFAGLYNLPLGQPGALLSIGLGTLALGAVATLFVPLAEQTRAREILLPVVLLPLLTPVIIGAVQATLAAVTPGAPGQPPWTGLLAACAALFLGCGYLLYGHLLGE